MQTKLTEFPNRSLRRARPGRPTGLAVRPIRRLGFGAGLALLAACLLATQSLQALPAAFPMQPGEVAVTFYSLSNPNGINVEVIDVRAPFGPLGANWLAPMFNNATPLTTNTWIGPNLGEVFGICLDDVNPPNIYVAATIAYGAGAPFGVAGPGGVYKLNGITGAITPFGAPKIVSGSASLGNICYDAAHKQFFVSDLDTGLIYRLNSAGVPFVSANDPYNHGVAGRLNAGLSTIPDNGVDGLTLAGRRVWGLQVYNSRLYYGVWNATTTATEIWSVGLDATGAFIVGPVLSGNPKLEITIPIYGGSSYPVTDIAFSKSGKMLLAERTAYASGTTYATSAHQSRVMEYKLVGPTWVASGNSYYVGEIGPHYNAAGGVDYDCSENVFATGDALILSGGVALYGLQIIPAGGNTPATAISTSYLIDEDGDTLTQDKTRIGDVVTYRDTCGCLAVTSRSLDCLATNGTYAWNFCVTNGFNGPVGFLSFPDLPAGVTINHDIVPISPVLQPGQGTCLTLYITNTAGSTNLCFTVGAHSTNMVQCCSVTNCLTFTPCCAYVSSETVVPVKGPPPNCYNYSLTIQNESQDYISYIYFTPDPFSSCLTFTPDIIHLTPPLGPNQTTVIPAGFKVCVDPTCAKPLCFLISLHNSNLVQCCSTRRCLPAPGTPPIIVTNPPDGTVLVGPVSIPVAVGLGPDITFSSVQYLANGQIVAGSAAPPFSAIWSNAQPGNYVLRANGVETNGGGIWTSDPINLYVLDTNVPPSGLVLLATKSSGNQIQFSVVTRLGKTCCIEYTDSLAPQNWQILQITTGDGSIMSAVDTVTNAPHRFYRARMY